MPSCAGIGQVLRQWCSSGTETTVTHIIGIEAFFLIFLCRAKEKSPSYGRSTSHNQRGRQQTIYPTDCSKRGTDRKLRASTTQSTHQFVYLSHPLRFLSAAKNKAPFLDSRSIHKILVRHPIGWRKRESREAKPNDKKTVHGVR